MNETHSQPNPALSNVALPAAGWLSELPVAVRRLIFFGTATALSIGGTLLFADLLVRAYGPWHGPAMLLTLLFFILFSLVSLGFTHAFYGFFVLPFRNLNISSQISPKDLRAPFDRTAIVFPVYNENVERVFEGLRAVYLSLKRTGRLDDFEFFVLSDSTSIDHWVREEFVWGRICRELDAFGRIFYRHRAKNTHKKAGNIADFCRTWGGRYTYMIVMDADSIMKGRDIVRMVALMQKHPRIGLLQTAPRLVGGESLIGRVQQFANRLYGPMFTAGLNFWQESEGNYWGHNAIIRVQPFTDYCDLPDLPGREPFGGKILSHDFVEAALMRKAGWEVWLAWDIEGSYEEGPQSIIELAQRDRRWLQGNIQHTWLLFARGLHPANKVHLAMGVLGYLASPFWFAFLLVGVLLVHRHNSTGLSLLPGDGAINSLLPGLTFQQHGLIVFASTMGVLFAPKLLAIIQVAFSKRFRRSLGGMLPVLSGMLIETVVSTLVAPIFMLFHTKFIVWLFLGRSVNWSAQVRGAKGTAWSQAAGTHFSQVVVGLIWAGLAFLIDKTLFIWMLPVLTGMILSIPISVWTSRAEVGDFLKKTRLLLVPEDVFCPWELREVAARMESSKPPVPSDGDLYPFEGISRAVVDPYVNAVHVSLLDPSKKGDPSVEQLAVRIATEGPGRLTSEELKLILGHPDTVLQLHRKIWMTPASELSDWWRKVVTAYRRAA